MDNRDVFLEYLMAVDNQAYFFMAGNVLGKISSPFTKAAVNQKIVSFFMNADNRKGICASLDELDVKCITFLHLLGGASEDVVCTFFGDIGRDLVSDRLYNLKSRLILICREGKIVANPLLESALVSYAIDPSCILGENSASYSTEPVFDRNALFAVLSLFLSGAVPAREANFHHFAKSGRLSTVFPQFEIGRAVSAFKAIGLFLKDSGALYYEKSRFHVDTNALSPILELSPLSFGINVVCSKFRELGSLGPAISRLIAILRIHSMTASLAKSLLCALSTMDDSDAEDVLNCIEDLGLAVSNEGILTSNPMLYEAPVPRSLLRTDSNLTVSYFGQSPSNEILYLFADIQVCDNLVTYQISKESFSRALEYNLDKGTIMSILGNNELEAVFSQWERAFSRVTAYEGIVIRCQDEQTCNMVRLHPEIKDHILLELGQNQLLLNRSTVDTWEAPLAYALDMARINIKGTESRNEDTDPCAVALTRPECIDFPAYKTETKPSWDELRLSLYKVAEDRNCLTNEVGALIDSKLITSPSQLEVSNYSSLLSASGFDFNAKTVLLKDVLKARNAIVILELAQDLVVARPLALEKDSEGRIMLKAITIPGCEHLCIAVSQIFKITVVRK